MATEKPLPKLHELERLLVIGMLNSTQPGYCHDEGHFKDSRAYRKAHEAAVKIAKTYGIYIPIDKTHNK